MNRKEFLELFEKHLKRTKYIHGDWGIYKTGWNLDWAYSRCPFRGCGWLYMGGTRNNNAFCDASDYFDYYWGLRLNKQMIRVWKRVFEQKKIEDHENFSKEKKWRGR